MSPSTPIFGVSDGACSLISPGTILPRLPIRAKLLIAFAGLSVVPVLLVGAYAITVNLHSLERVALDNLTDDVNAIRSRTGNFLSIVEGDIRVLRNSTHLADYVHGRMTAQSLAEAAGEFAAFARTKRLYYQIRVLGNDGDELVRIEMDQPGDSASEVRIVPPGLLRHGKESYYALLTSRLGPGGIAYAPAEVVYGRMKRVPVISFATPLERPDGRAGILVANVFARTLFDVIEPLPRRGGGEKVILVGSNGYYLYDSHERDNWNRLIASREEENLQKDYPPAVAAAILSGREGVVTEGTSEIIAYAPLFPGLTGGRLPPDGTSSLFVFETVPRSTITQDARTSAWTLGGLLLLFFTSAVGLGLLATRQFTRPIAELQKGAGIISQGNYHHRLAVETGDEMELLANQFNRMASSLEDHEREILQHRSTLEEMVQSRTRELIDEKGKLQAILDTVPIAFVMLDDQFRIRSVSAAFSSITGIPRRDVIGQDGREIFQTRGLCQARWDHTLTQPGKIESHIDRVADPAGQERYLDHMAISIAREGGGLSILQIITDVTQRKRLEEHLIRSEKLMATGEMAAIIAHGFRNSLTSIKMILQLHQESKRLRAPERRSLRVALDSIGRMEGVVQELLNFARPSPMQFALHDLNHLIEDGLALIAPRLKSRRVTIRKHLDRRLPPLPLDATRIRDALVNLLVNALQSFENGPTVRRSARISISTRRHVMQKTLREFHPPGGIVGGPPDQRTETELRKGRACALVTVSDSGPGIERETLKRVFDPFFTTKTDGTGLGLPMVRRTIIAHGGFLSLRSSKGRGTTVEIYLPLHPSAASSPETDRPI